MLLQLLFLLLLLLLFLFLFLLLLLLLFDFNHYLLSSTIIIDFLYDTQVERGEKLLAMSIFGLQILCKCTTYVNVSKTMPMTWGMVDSIIQLSLTTGNAVEVRKAAIDVLLCTVHTRGSISDIESRVLKEVLDLSPFEENYIPQTSTRK